MTKQSLEGITYDAELEGNLDYSLPNIQTDKGYSDLKNSLLEYFKDNVKGKKRKEEIGNEVDRIFSKYVRDIKRYSPIPRRASMLEQSYNSVPDESELDGKNPQEVLNQRLYSNPGRQYTYLNGIVGAKKKSKDIKYELGKAAQYTLKEGWPVLGAGAGWWLANRWYKKGSKAKKALANLDEIYKPLSKPWEYLLPGPAGHVRIATDAGLALAKREAKREIAKGVAKGAFDNKWWEYLVPGIGPARLGIDAGKYVIGKGLRSIWGLIKTPCLYAIGAYAAYKTIGYFLKRRKEKKLEKEEIERLEGMRNDMNSQRRIFYSPEQQMREVA